MKPMYFKLYHNPENKTLTIPRAALQLSGLADAEELILHTGGGYVLAARNALSTLECLHLLQFLTSTAASLLLQLAVFSQEGAEFPECEDTLEEEDEMDDPGLTIPTCLLELAGLDEADSLEAVAEDGRVIVSKAEDDDPSEHREEDPLQEFDEGFRAMLQEGNVDLRRISTHIPRRRPADGENSLCGGPVIWRTLTARMPFRKPYDSTTTATIWTRNA